MNEEAMKMSEVGTPAQRIRPLALCIVRRPTDGRYLVMRGDDPVKGETFHRPLGGGIEFGETGEEAVRREMFEEIGAELTNVKQIGFFENIFIYRGEPGHELVLLFEAEFPNASLYGRERFEIIEERGPVPVIGLWQSMDELAQFPLYPDGLWELLKSDGAGIADPRSDRL